MIGALLALALWRFRFPGKPALEGAMALPIVIPEICMGVALMAFFMRTGWPTDLGWPLNLGPVIIGHVAFSFPFVAVVVRARMAGFDRALEEASKDLGRRRVADASATSSCPHEARADRRRACSR